MVKTGEKRQAIPLISWTDRTFKKIRPLTFHNFKEI